LQLVVDADFIEFLLELAAPVDVHAG